MFDIMALKNVQQSGGHSIEYIRNNVQNKFFNTDFTIITQS